MRAEDSRGVSVGYTFCLLEVLLEEAEGIAARLPEVELRESAMSEESVREFCRMKYRAAVALSIGLMSLECLINEYLHQMSSKVVPGHAKYRKLRQRTLEKMIRAACDWILRGRSEKKFLQELMEETLSMREFLLELKAIPYNFDLGVLITPRAKPRNPQVQALSNLNRTFVLDSIHAIRSLADLLSTTRVGMPKPMVFLRFRMNPVA